MATATADPNAAVLANARAAANNQSPTAGSNAASTPGSGPASTQGATPSGIPLAALIKQIPAGAPPGFAPSTPADTGDAFTNTELGRNVYNAVNALPGVAPAVQGAMEAYTAGRALAGAGAVGGRLAQLAMGAAQAAPVARLAPYAPVAAGALALSNAAAPASAPAPAVPSAAPAASPAAPAPAAAPAAAPVPYSTDGNIVVNGRDASGRANAFSGQNIGGNAAYVNPDGTPTVVGGTGVSAGAGAPAGVASANEGGIGPVLTRNATGQTAGLIVPAASPAAYQGSSGVNFGLSPAEQFNAGATALPIRAALQAPDTSPAIQRANNIQDMQVQLAQQALALASTGNLSDAIMAKHIRSTIASLSGASRAGSEAVNPLLNQEQASATSERNTNVADSTARQGQVLQASTSKYATDADLFSRQPQHVQQAVIAQLARLASQPGPAGEAALARLHQYMLVMKSPAQQLVSDVTGANTYVYDPVTGNFHSIPAAQPVGRGAPMPVDVPDRTELYRRTAAKNAAAQAQSAQ